jgi:hypothetical protein
MFPGATPDFPAGGAGADGLPYNLAFEFDFGAPIAFLPHADLPDRIRHG